MQHEALHATARAVAEHLPGFRYRQEEENGWVAKLDGPDGQALLIAGSYYPKLEISGSYPSFGTRLCSPRDYGAIAYAEQPPKMGCNAERGPAIVAREIRRRFLPHYTGIYEKCRRRRAEMEDQARQVRAFASELAAVLGIKPKNGEHESTISLYGAGSLWANAHITDPRVCSFDLHNVPRDKAIRIAEIVAESWEPCD